MPEAKHWSLPSEVNVLALSCYPVRLFLGLCDHLPAFLASMLFALNVMRKFAESEQ